MPAQGARRAVHLPRKPFQPGRCVQLLRQQLANPSQPCLATGEFKVQAPAALAHGFVSNRVGQRQRHIQPSPFEGKGIVLGGETDRALKRFGIERVVTRARVFEACAKQRQWPAKQVVTDDFQ
ncbi:hypothetical protein D3C77_580180 [compost metagenome]